MSKSISNNKTIAKNTFFLYFNMMFTMLVALYTSRVVLQVLGVEDFGIYQTVGGVVMMLSSVNGALSTGSSRFLTYELGRGDTEKLQKTFSTTLTIHIILALLIALVAETFGLWFVYNKLVIAPDRLHAAVIAYHLSILTALITITQVPYTASIISHEKMSIYAYLSIVEVILKLSVVYLLTISHWDKLIVYAVLLCILQISIALFYRFYCIKNFRETHFRMMFDRRIMKDILSYSGWNLWANTTIAFINQGATVLINLFFLPTVVTARAIANQVNMAANQFVSNFRTAANPQIVKRYAAGDYDGSKRLLLSSTKYSYFMMLSLCLPVCLVAEPLIQLWLGQIPEYTVIFLQLTIVTSLFQVFDSSFYTALYAKGQIKENAMISPTILFLAFPITYLLFKLGYGPVSLAWVLLIGYSIVGLIVKPILIIKIAMYTWKDIFSVFIPCIKVTIAAIPIPCLLYIYRNELFFNSVVSFLTLSIVSVVCVSTASWIMGIDKEVKNKLIGFAKMKIKAIKRD
ncbi:lipopolysaccharide biosynthesis protein [Phocaeicola sp.]